MNGVTQYKVFLMDSKGIIEHLVNCANEFSAKCIAEAIHPKKRVIKIKVNK